MPTHERQHKHESAAAKYRHRNFNHLDVKCCDNFTPPLVKFFWLTDKPRLLWEHVPNYGRHFQSSKCQRQTQEAPKNRRVRYPYIQAVAAAEHDDRCNATALNEPSESTYHRGSTQYFINVESLDYHQWWNQPGSGHHVHARFWHYAATVGRWRRISVSLGNGQLARPATTADGRRSATHSSTVYADTFRSKQRRAVCLAGPHTVIQR